MNNSTRLHDAEQFRMPPMPRRFIFLDQEIAMRCLLTILCGLWTAGLCSCGRSSEPDVAAVKLPSILKLEEESSSAAAGRSMSTKDMASLPRDGEGVTANTGGLDVRPVSAIRARMVIKTAELGFEVESYDDATAQIQKWMEAWNGFVSHSTTEIPYENVKSGTWILRIPSDRFETALSELKKLASKLERESIGGQDVTEEFYDLEARLQNKLLEEKQVRDILKRAGTIHDVLEVQRELSTIRETIDRFEGRKKYLIDQAGLSTITVNLHERYPVAVSASGGFWATIGNGFREGFRGFANVLSGTITFLIAGIPVFVLLGLCIWLFVRFIRRLRAGKRTP